MRQGALVFQTDFGMQDGAVSAMYGVAYGVSHMGLNPTTPGRPATV